MNSPPQRLFVLLAIILAAIWLQAAAQEPERPPARSVLDAPQPKFEPRQKFEGEPPNVAISPIEPIDLPPAGPRLDHGLIGPRGTFDVCGWHGDASFLWPMDSKSPRLY